MTQELGRAEIAIEANTSSLVKSGKDIDKALSDPLKAAQANAQAFASELGEKAASQVRITTQQLMQANALIQVGVNEAQALSVVLGQNVTEAEGAEIVFRQWAEAMELSNEQIEELVPAIRQAAEEAQAAATQTAAIAESTRGLGIAGSEAFNLVSTSARLAGVQVAGLSGGVTALRSALNLLKGHPVIATLTALTTIGLLVYNRFQSQKRAAEEYAEALAEIRVAAQGVAISLLEMAGRGGEMGALRQLQDFSDLVGPQVIQQLRDMGYEIPVLLSDLDALRSALQGTGNAMYGLIINTPEVTQLFAQLNEQAQRNAEANQLAAILAEQAEQRRQQAFLDSYGVAESTFAGIEAGYAALSQAAWDYSSDLAAAFANAGNVIDGVPEQINVTAEAIAQNSAAILGETATMIDNYATALEAGMPRVAEAILEGGVAANQAFADLLNNPELARATEQNLQRTTDLVTGYVDEATQDWISDNAHRYIDQGFYSLSQTGIDALIKGLDDAHPRVRAAVERLTQSTITSLNQGLGNRSPSVHGQIAGDYLVIGVEHGIRQATPRAEETARDEAGRIASTYTRSVVSAMRNASGGVAAAAQDVIAQALSSVSAVIGRLDAQMSLANLTSQLGDLREEHARLMEGITASEVLAVERAQAQLDRLLQSRENVADAQDRVREAEEGLLRSQQAGDRWAEYQYQEELKRARALLATAEERQASDAEIAVARERLADAENAPAERRLQLLEQIERAEWQLVKAQISAMQAMHAEARALQEQTLRQARANLESLASKTGLGPAVLANILSLISSMVIPGLAEGGPAQAGRPYLVGERGPELFVPHTSGQVLPNGSFGEANIVVHVEGGSDPYETGRIVGVAILDTLADVGQMR